MPRCYGVPSCHSVLSHAVSHCSLSYPIRSCFFVPSVPSYVSSLLVLLRNLIKSEQMDKVMASQICTDGAIATAWLYVQSLLKMLLNENYAALHEYVLEVRMHYYMMFCNVYAIACFVERTSLYNLFFSCCCYFLITSAFWAS